MITFTCVICGESETFKNEQDAFMALNSFKHANHKRTWIALPKTLEDFSTKPITITSTTIHKHISCL